MELKESNQYFQIKLLSEEKLLSADVHGRRSSPGRIR